MAMSPYHQRPRNLRTHGQNCSFIQDQCFQAYAGPVFLTKMTTLLWLTLLLFVQSASGQSHSAHPTAAGARPNILFILVDDMGWNVLSSYGDLYVKTPNIDRLATEGMRFTQAYVPSMCCPSRAEFLSGQYGARTGITEQGAGTTYPHAPLITPKHIPNKLPEDNYTIANMLHDAGYATMVSGKWNVGDGYRVAELKAKRGDQYFKPYGFNYIGDAQEKGWQQIDQDKGDTAIVQDFCQFLQTRDNRPFFAYLAFFAPHTPIGAPDSLVQQFLARGFPKSTDPFGNAQETPTADFLAMIKYLDQCIGTLLDSLDQKGLTNNTLVVFMSDNGGMNRDWDNAPLRGAKGVFYEGGIRVPLLMRWPGHIPQSSQTDVPVAMIDMFPTFKALADGSTPPTKILDGVSLLPLLTQSGSLGRQALYWHRPQYIHDYGQTPNSTIRLGDYKLIHYYGDYLDTRGFLPQRNKPYGRLLLGARNELFNLRTDPGERNNLYGKEPEKARLLLDSLKHFLQRTHASIPLKNDQMIRSEWYKHIRTKGPRETQKVTAQSHFNP